MIDHKKQNPSLGMLLSPRKDTAEIAIQTENDGKRPFDSRKLSAKKFPDRDAEVMDWGESFVFKKAMANEARKRGLEVKSEYKVEEIAVEQDGYETQNVYELDTNQDKSAEQLPYQLNTDLGVLTPNDET